MSNTVQERPHFIINVVHGTWGRGILFPGPSRPNKPYWFETGSCFSNDLTARLNEAGVSHKLVPFEWSGSNSIEARGEAAQCLAQRFCEQLGQSSGDRILTIAHSHGGNVALRAVQILRDTDANNAASNAQSPMWVATIATPFVRLFKTTKPPLSTPKDVLKWVIGSSILLLVTFSFFPSNLFITFIKQHKILFVMTLPILF